MSNDSTQPVHVAGDTEAIDTDAHGTTDDVQWIEPVEQSHEATEILEDQMMHEQVSHEQVSHEQVAHDEHVATMPTPTYVKGPAPTPIIIGLIGLLTLVGTALWALTDSAVNWAVATPVGIVLVGLVIIVLGVNGLRRPRA